MQYFDRKRDAVAHVLESLELEGHPQLGEIVATAAVEKRQSILREAGTEGQSHAVIHRYAIDTCDVNLVQSLLSGFVSGGTSLGLGGTELATAASAIVSAIFDLAVQVTSGVHRLTEQQAAILLVLKQNPGISQSQIVERLAFEEPVDIDALLAGLQDIEVGRNVTRDLVYAENDKWFSKV